MKALATYQDQPRIFNAHELAAMPLHQMQQALEAQENLHKRLKLVTHEENELLNRLRGGG